MPQGGPPWGTELHHLVRWMVGFPHLQRHFFFFIISNLWDDALNILCPMTQWFQHLDPYQSQLLHYRVKIGDFLILSLIRNNSALISANSGKENFLLFFFWIIIYGHRDFFGWWYSSSIPDITWIVPNVTRESLLDRVPHAFSFDISLLVFEYILTFWYNRVNFYSWDPRDI